MIFVTRLVGRIDVRIIIFVGMAISAVSLWQMTGFSLQMGMGPLITTGILQGFGLGFVFTQLQRRDVFDAAAQRADPGQPRSSA